MHLIQLGLPPRKQPDKPRLYYVELQQMDTLEWYVRSPPFDNYREAEMWESGFQAGAVHRYNTRIVSR